MDSKSKRFLNSEGYLKVKLTPGKRTLSFVSVTTRIKKINWSDPDILKN
ncbi:hypothetical protein KKC1_33130 [Calderihabitans maritimus]|uniref:Uncharacterized protein n=1 Tax=Calderihabitans maritimus TaxID=1246530 RepID=A0A1Z5HY32_9FIRM|nr:hypothetical protein KKC1_33130 [Calderihabitans maritimus]